MGRQRKRYAAVPERCVLDTADRRAVERLAAGIWSLEHGSEAFLPLERQGDLGENVGSGD